MGGREVALCILNEFRIIGGSAFSALWDSGSDGLAWRLLSPLAIPFIIKAWQSVGSFLFF
jgi:hypothetical protein